MYFDIQKKAILKTKDNNGNQQDENIHPEIQNLNSFKKLYKDIISMRYKAIAKLLTEINEQGIAESAKSIGEVEKNLVTPSIVATKPFLNICSIICPTNDQKTAGETSSQKMENVKFWLERLKYHVGPKYSYMLCGYNSCFTRCSMCCSFCRCSMLEYNERNNILHVKKYLVSIVSSLHYLLELVKT